MEYADGGTLQDYLKKEFTKLTWENKCDLACQLACAILFLHNEDVAHCDLVNSLIIYLTYYIYI